MLAMVGVILLLLGLPVTMVLFGGFDFLMPAALFGSLIIIIGVYKMPMIFVDNDSFMSGSMGTVADVFNRSEPDKISIRPVRNFSGMRPVIAVCAAIWRRELLVGWGVVIEMRWRHV